MPKPISLIQGFTLIELMVTISIAAILMGLAIPSFNSSITNSRLTSAANQLVTALNYARSEAVKRGLQVSITRKSATASEWEAGWDIFVDSDGSNAFNDDGDAHLCETNADGSPAEDCLLRTYDALPVGYTLRTNNTSYQNFAAYAANGASTNAADEVFRLCDSTLNTANARAIAINTMGRPNVTKGATACP